MIRIGIESRLDYLVRLEVGGIWLSPIYQSPMADFGYDISDFTKIDPIFGTMDDFVSLINSAHSKGHSWVLKFHATWSAYLQDNILKDTVTYESLSGIKLIMDFVPNHSSDQHEWFKRSLRREDPYTDYYVWVDPKGFNETTNEPIPPSNWVNIAESKWILE